MFNGNRLGFDRKSIITYQLREQLFPYNNWNVNLTFLYKYAAEKCFTQRITAEFLGHISFQFIVFSLCNFSKIPVMMFALHE